MLTNATEQYLRDNHKLNEKGDIMIVTQSQYLTLIEEQHQIKPELLKAQAEADKSVTSAMIAVSAEHLAERIRLAKANGEDPSELESSIRVSRPSGQLQVTVRTTRTTVNPKSGEHITQHGVSTVRVRTKGMIDPDAASRASALITKLLG